MRNLNWILLPVLVVSISISIWLRVRVESLGAAQVQIEWFSVSTGMTANDVVSALAPELSELDRWLLFISNPRFGHIQAGQYAFAPKMLVLDALEKLHFGDAIIERFTIPEGLTTEELLARVNEANQLTGMPIEWSTSPLSPSFSNPEGAYLAETYIWRQQMSRIEFLTLTHETLLDELNRAWNQADKYVKAELKSPYALLILASIVEKETALASERPRIAGVFVNRLQLGMRLQTDPTVIYGLGNRFDGNLTREHLREKTPYNTYVIRGLPPTPVALVGPDALMAVARPEMTGDLYFVADGTGGHAFSKTLEEHNSNVRKYQLKR